MQPPRDLDLPTLAAFRDAVRALDLSPGSGSRMTEVEPTKAALTAAGLWPLLCALVDGDEIGWCRLVILGPSQQIPAHKDPALPGGWVRHHFVLWANDRCYTYNRGIWRYRPEGEHYVMDPSEWHGAVNWGSEARVHLLIDVKPRV